ncbi:MAG: hypothetical protein A3F11_04150 [Gammaproteobacteria bacterium RIFCSPHIGHO2_12_FULL_37_14]|nr:MAG: hypothetical protein A3F11_04150 [Gammaproteobacteria bacterium RIFCSPHIGHO2_12_FULL_37_14]
MYGGEVRHHSTKDICGKAYFIELKQPKPKMKYDFKNFKQNDVVDPTKKNLLFINFQCLRGSRIFLPRHLECYVIQQENSIFIDGAYQLIHSNKRKHEQENVFIEDVEKVSEVTDIPVSTLPQLNLNEKPAKKIKNTQHFPDTSEEPNQLTDNKRTLSETKDDLIALDTSPDKNLGTGTIKHANESAIINIQYRDIVEFTLAYWDSHSTQLNNDNIETYIENSYHYLPQPSSFGRTLQCLLVNLNKNDFESIKKLYSLYDKSSFSFTLNKLIDYYLTTIETDPLAINNNSEYSRRLIAITYQLTCLMTKKNYYIQAKAFSSHLISRLIKQLLLLPKTNDMRINSVMWSFGQLAKHDHTRNFLKELTAENILGLVQIKSSSRFGFYFANYIWSIATLAEHGMLHLLEQLTAAHIKNLIDKLLTYQEPTGQAYSNTLWAIAKLAKQGLSHLLETLTASHIRDLVFGVLDCRKKIYQDFDNTLWAIAKLAEKGMSHLLKKLTAAQIEELTLNLLDYRKKYEDGDNALWAIAKIAENDMSHLLETLTASNIRDLVFGLLHRKKSYDKTYGVSLWAIAKLAEKDMPHLLETLTASNIRDLIIQFLRCHEISEPQIGRILWTIAKLAEKNMSHLLQELTATHVENLFFALSKCQEINKPRSHILWAVAKLAERGKSHLLEKLMPTDIQDLVQSLFQCQQINGQACGMMLWSIAKLAERGKSHLLKKLTATNIQQIVYILLHCQQVTSIACDNALFMITKLAEQGELHLLEELTPIDVQKIVSIAANCQLDSQHRCTTLLAISKLAEQNQSILLSELKSENIKKLIDLALESNLYRDIYNFMIAISKFAEYPNLINNISTVQINSSLDKFVHSNHALVSEQAGMYISALCQITEYLVKQPNENLEETKKIIHDIVYRYCTSTLDKQSLLSTHNKKNKLFTSTVLLTKLEQIMLLKQQKLLDISVTLLSQMIDNLNQLLAIYLGHKQFDRLIEILLKLAPYYALSSEIPNLLDKVQDYLKIFTASYRQHIQEKLSLIYPYLNIPDKNKITSSINTIEALLPIKIEKMDAPLTQKYKKSPTIKLPERKVPFYRIHNPTDIKQLVKDQGDAFIYDAAFNKRRTTISLFIAPVAVLGDELGVYADQKIEASEKTIGCYAGKRSAVEENKSSKYIFSILNKDTDGEDDEDEAIEEFIDGYQQRDWTSYINHTAGNIQAEQKTVAGIKNIYFHPCLPIEKNDLLLLDYGDDYFEPLNFHPYYLHSSDNWNTSAQVYNQYKEHYAEGSFVFNDAVRDDLQLANSEWLIPKTFLSIFNNNSNVLAEELKNSPSDLLAYAYQDNEMRPSSQQQHMTALMFACYLGREECIQILLKTNADANRFMLVSGFSPLSLLLKGKGNIEVVEKIGLHLLNSTHKLPYPIILDRDKRDILHYAIVRNSPILVKKILEVAREMKHDIFKEMFNRNLHLPPYADYDYCISHSQFGVLEVMLHEESFRHPLTKKAFLANIQEGLIFREETFSSASLKQLMQLKKVLERFDSHLKETAIIAELTQYIHKRSITEKSFYTLSNSFFQIPRGSKADYYAPGRCELK